MQRRLRSGTIVLVLAGTVALAAAQTNAPGPAPGLAPSGSVGTSSQDKLALTPEQKSAIFAAVDREKAKVKPPANVSASVGAEIPPASELHMLPDHAVADAPAAKAYRYTIVQNAVVLVDPTNMRIVEVIRQ